ncbi:MAG: ABC transporter ATP-binding protein [bacterium]|nr:ABC transporter ATP-binding protein [bacterium]MDY4108320.1 ABC transporter ATP-binding protein [Bacilli bacterium]
MKNAIEIRKLKKKYDDNFELGEINLDIPSGYVIGLIGENGAGKTTLIKSILSIINIDSGDIKIFNKNNKDEYLVKEDIGVVLDGMFFPEIMTINDINIVMKSIYKNWDSELFNKYLRKFKLSKSKKIKELSKGMRKKLEIVTALSHHPKLLILDEPTSGLDPVVRNDILEIFLDFIRDEEHTILFSTHITSDLEHIADEIVFIDNGKVILNENKDELLDNYGALKCSIDSFSKIDKDDIIRYKKNKYNYEILVSDRNKISKKYKDCVVDKITLEDLMILVIKGEK